ncbi:MAG: peptidoglycan DD-metalloendopeptidase family protein [Alphaproteobacteria bacterium]
MERTASRDVMARAVRAVMLALIPLLLANCATAFDGGYGNERFIGVRVERGDTVYSLAHRHNVRQDDIVAINGLRDRHTLLAGQTIRVPAYGRLTQRAPHHPARSTTLPGRQQPVAVAYRPKPSAPRATEAVWWKDFGFGSESSGAQFLRPVNGPVISPFGVRNNGERNDGINIAARAGAPVLAAEAGTVTYVGNELKGYGNLVLLRHDNGYVTAYAHTGEIVVQRGQRVARGQTIAYAGASGDVSEPQLHFEIRRGTKPVNPQPLLMASSS